MKKMIISVMSLTMMAMEAKAGPYFRFDPLNEVKAAVYYKVGTPVENVLYGSQTSIFKHHAEDGYLLMPGISWSLLDVGAIKSVNNTPGSLILGPSIDLSEPVKMYISKILDYAGIPAAAFRFILQPMKPGEKSIGLSVGPSMALTFGDYQHISQIKGAFLLHSGLSARL